MCRDAKRFEDGGAWARVFPCRGGKGELGFRLGVHARGGAWGEARDARDGAGVAPKAALPRRMGVGNLVG